MNQAPTLLRHLLITGLPGCGKTTLIKRLAQALGRFHPAGFYTEEIRFHGQRRGFRLVGLDGTEGILSHTDFHDGPRVGRYGVAIDRFEEFLDALNLDRETTPLVFIDEIGKMECLSEPFVHLVQGLLDSQKTVVATIALKGTGFIADVKRRSDVQIIEIDRHNRDRLATKLAIQIAALVAQ